MKEILKAGDVVLPSPTAMTINDELIWSEETGRLMNAMMQGEVVAEKKNLSIKWEYLTEEEVKSIKDNVVGGYFPLTFIDMGMTFTIESYRGTLGKELAGEYGGVIYYKTVSVDIIER